MIRFTYVHKAFGPKQVLRGVSLDIPDGQTTVLLGFSGTGKSVSGRWGRTQGTVVVPGNRASEVLGSLADVQARSGR